MHSPPVSLTNPISTRSIRFLLGRTDGEMKEGKARTCWSRGPLGDRRRMGREGGSAHLLTGQRDNERGATLR